MKTDCNENVSRRPSLASELLSRLPQSFGICTKVLMVARNAFTETSSQLISVSQEILVLELLIVGWPNMSLKNRAVSQALDPLVLLVSRNSGRHHYDKHQYSLTHFLVS